MELPPIAIVDDDALVRASLNRLLRAFGYDVRVFQSANDFLEEGLREPFACLILDLCMPEMSGMELFARLKDSGHILPTILTSAHENLLRRAAHRFPEAAEQLQKPFDDDQLLRAIEKTLKSGSSLRGGGDGA